MLLVLVLLLAPVAHAVAALAEVPRTASHETQLHSADHHIFGEIRDCDGCCHATSNAGCALMCANGGVALAVAISARVVERTGIRPHAVHLLEPGTLPRTSSGKLRRGEALRLLLAGELRAPPPATFLRLAREAARSMAARLRSGL